MTTVANHRQKLDRILAADSGITRSEISGCMTLDSRKVGQGDIFVALPGASMMDVIMFSRLSPRERVWYSPRQMA